MDPCRISIWVNSAEEKEEKKTQREVEKRKNTKLLITGGRWSIAMAISLVINNDNC